MNQIKRSATSVAAFNLYASRSSRIGGGITFSQGLRLVFASCAFIEIRENGDSLLVIQLDRPLELGLSLRVSSQF